MGDPGNAFKFVPNSYQTGAQFHQNLANSNQITSARVIMWNLTIH
jgi:hypothetical protein